MIDVGLGRQITRAKELLVSVRHAAMSTVNADGSPHNTPFYFIRDPQLEYIYWGSHPDSLHSQNVLRTGKIFVVLYDAIERGGLYISAETAHILEGEELAKALALHNAQRAAQGEDPIELSYYAGESPQRMWGARITHFWVNSTERDENGHVLKDGRQEVTREDLLI